MYQFQDDAYRVLLLKHKVVLEIFEQKVLPVHENKGNS